MDAAKNGLERIVTAAQNLRFLAETAKAGRMSGEETEAFAKTRGFVDMFEKAMEDDFNTADAVAAVFELVKYANTTANGESSREYVQKLYELLARLTDVLGIIVEQKEEILDAEIEGLIAKRQAARKERDFARADEIRAELLEKGIVLEDTREGVKWKKA